MTMSALAAAFLAFVAAGGLAYVFLYPLLSGEVRAEKRQKALVGAGADRRGERSAGPTVSRRDQVAQSLKDIEARERAKTKLTLEAKIIQAGLGWDKSKFYLFSAVLGVVLALLVLATMRNPFAALGALFAGAVGLPQWILVYLKKRRIKRFIAELPNAMDVIVRGIKSGLPLGDCMREIASTAQEPLRSEFRFIVESQQLGISLGEAVTKLYERVPVPEANFFGIVIGIQQKSGGNLSEALGNLSRVLRERKKMRGKVSAMSMEAKASAAIIASLPFVVAILTYISSPSYIELLWTTTAGKVGLAASAVWMTIGVLVMRKMITFDI